MYQVPWRKAECERRNKEEKTKMCVWGDQEGEEMLATKSKPLEFPVFHS